MDQIKHNYIEVNGLNLHVAEIGSVSSPAVIFLHGFPEIWYTWRHQMIAVANAGFRAIVPDYRGYGLSDIPEEPKKTSFFDFVKDTASILEYLNISKVFVIGKDFGSKVGYTFALFNPQKVAAIVSLGVAFRPPGSRAHQPLPEGYYINRWKEPGRAEADFGQFDAKTVVKNIYIIFSRSEIPIANENQEIMDLVDPSTPLPSWFTEDDLAVYGDLYQKSGFQTPLQVPYRILNSKVEVSKQAPKDLKVEAPTLLIMGEKDFVFGLPGTAEYIRSGEVKKYLPNLETVNIAE
ncbi:putative soluble epoxide hydrolase [Helianthus debilis subsp. tardiflorus]